MTETYEASRWQVFTSEDIVETDMTFASPTVGSTEVVAGDVNLCPGAIRESIFSRLVEDCDMSTHGDNFGRPEGISGINISCSGHGACNSATGSCTCAYDYVGPGCSFPRTESVE